MTKRSEISTSLLQIHTETRQRKHSANGQDVFRMIRERLKTSRNFSERQQDSSLRFDTKFGDNPKGQQKTLIFYKH